MANDGRSVLEKAHAPAADPVPEKASAPGQRSVFSVATSVAGTGIKAAGTVTARALGLGTLGLFLGIVGFFVEQATGLLAHPWEPWSYLVYLLLLIYALVGALCLGTAGVWRGIGRVAMNLVERHELTRHIVDRVFERASILTVGMASVEALNKPLPIEAARKALKQAMSEYSNSDDIEGGARGLTRAILRRLKLWVCRQVEARLNEFIGEETRDASIAELSLARIRKRAQEELDNRVMDALDGARNRPALVWGALFALVLALPPLVLARLR